jgi:hypothetical protein
MKIILHVNIQAEKLYEKSKELGTLAASAFLQSGQTSQANRERHRSQMKGLENIAETTRKSTDVLDYIKKQIARKQSGWVTELQYGEKLKAFLEDGLTGPIDEICREVGITGNTEQDRRDRQQIRLHLIRQFVRQMVIQYEYSISDLGRKNSA